MRRQFNLAFFKRLLIWDEGTVTGELAEPFETMLGEELRRAVVASEAEELTTAVDDALRQRDIDGQDEQNDQRPQEPEPVLVGAGAATTIADRGGFSPNILVRMRGLEPPPSYLDTDLNRARLPIPPHPRDGGAKISHQRPGDDVLGSVDRRRRLWEQVAGVR